MGKKTKIQAVSKKKIQLVTSITIQVFQGLFVRNPNFKDKATDEISEKPVQETEETNITLGSDGEEMMAGESDRSDENEETSGESGSDEVEVVTTNGKRKKHISEKSKAKKAKIVRSLNKPLTVEEINELKETEDLYHSNLFRMQIDETLKEIRVKKKQKSAISTWMDRMMLLLNTMNQREIQAYFEDDNYPLKFPPVSPEKLKTVVFDPPERAGIFGSQSVGTNIGPDLEVDIFLIMSSKYLRHEDYANQTYYHKRALFLFHIFKKLSKKKDLCEEVEIREVKNDSMKPVICVKNEGITYLIHAIPKEDFFKLNRFIPKTNNIKLSAWKEGDPLVPTPHYNASILQDITIEKNQRFIEQHLDGHDNVKNALKLLKIWLKQREFDSEINGFVVTMYLVYLILIHKIYPTMSCYQIIRLFWNQFGEFFQ
jgi:U3 small nucleolar RNA-associated protein 22